MRPVSGSDNLMRRNRDMHFCEAGYSRDRAAEQRYANLHHYFWLPCGICGFEYGGHEKWGASIPVLGSPGVDRGVCLHCKSVATEYMLVDDRVVWVGSKARALWEKFCKAYSRSRRVWR